MLLWLNTEFAEIFWFDFPIDGLYHFDFHWHFDLYVIHYATILTYGWSLSPIGNIVKSIYSPVSSFVPSFYPFIHSAGIGMGTLSPGTNWLPLTSTRYYTTCSWTSKDIQIMVSGVVNSLNQHLPFFIGVPSQLNRHSRLNPVIDIISSPGSNAYLSIWIKMTVSE